MKAVRIPADPTPPAPAPAAGRHAWDRVMSAKEIKTLSPSHRGRRALLSFKRKVAAVEAEAARPADAPVRAGLPTDRAKLRRWAAPDEGLWEWSAPQFDHPSGRNAHLAARVQAAVDLLHARKRRGRAGLRAALAAKDALVSTLEMQVAA